MKTYNACLLDLDKILAIFLEVATTTKGATELNMIALGDRLKLTLIEVVQLYYQDHYDTALSFVINGDSGQEDKLFDKFAEIFPRVSRPALDGYITDLMNHADVNAVTEQVLEHLSTESAGTYAVLRVEADAVRNYFYVLYDGDYRINQWELEHIDGKGKYHFEPSPDRVFPQ